MTAQQFNEKYKPFLEEGHYGLDIDIPELTLWLDEKFQEFIKRPGFTYSQIKSKFNTGRFYAEPTSVEEAREVEKYITEILNK